MRSKVPKTPLLTKLSETDQWSLPTTLSIPNYRSFDFFDIKFDHSSYSKIYVKYHFFVSACFINTSTSRIT